MEKQKDAFEMKCLVISYLNRHSKKWMHSCDVLREHDAIVNLDMTVSKSILGRQVVVVRGCHDGSQASYFTVVEGLLQFISINSTAQVRKWFCSCVCGQNLKQWPPFMDVKKLSWSAERPVSVSPASVWRLRDYYGLANTGRSTDGQKS